MPKEKKQKTIRGIFLQKDIKRIEEALGKKGIKEAEKKIGQSLNIVGYKNYPLGLRSALLEATAELVYGGTSGEVYKKMGREGYRSFSQTQLWKTISRIFANNPQGTLKNITKIFQVIVPDIRAEFIESSDTSGLIRVINNPYKPEYIQGYIEEGLKFLGIEPQVEYSQKPKNTTEYKISW